ncbi:ribonuclease HII [Roseiterribacter gracilis]|uniref:Ribonuclease HII n=1 Tax=Roseiterribacter gracilis TaxID=2812848 RepID=A0A8S8XC04_9PROT|nr:ribonuclease HII [Rhodospirillales bacterium TMPK1]
MSPTRPHFRFERAFDGVVAGCDEAGRGPLAGPVVAAAVILPKTGLPRRIAGRIDDSKNLELDEREALYTAIYDYADVGVAECSVAEIDTHNILRASLLAMARAVALLKTVPHMVLVDGNMAPPISHPVKTVIGGDATHLSIAAASIVAKVVRDRTMKQLHEEHPGYGWSSNVGYATPAHRKALKALGPTPHHRMSFAPCRDWQVLVEIGDADSAAA